MKSKKPRAAAKVVNTDEAEETLRAIRDGAVDAFVVQEPEGHRVYTLEGVDLPYSQLVERMQQGAAMLDAQGQVIYCNQSLAELLGVEREMTIGVPLQDFLAEEDDDACRRLVRESRVGASEGEMRLRRSDGTFLPARLSFRLLSRDKSAIGVLVNDLTSQKQQEKFTSRLQQMQDEERRRIARELHDSVGQLLVAIGMNISSVVKESHKLTPGTAKLVRENAEMVRQINNEIRTISHLLHPPLLDEVGLPSALRWYIDGFAERSHIEATLDLPDKLDRFPQEMEIAVFRAVQECLTNVHRHSGSPSCAVSILQDAERLRVEIKDAGRGIAKNRISNLSASGGVGLRGMQERIRQLGGTLEIDSTHAGTTVRATLPIPQVSQDVA